jgi:hypothetical protein
MISQLNSTISELEREYSREEFFALDLPDETEYELWQGKIVAHPYINFSGEHGKLLRN